MAIMMNKLVELLLTLQLISVCIGVNPCVDYAFIYMADGHRSSDFNSIDSQVSLCDAYLDPATWYRFEHNAGNRLIETPVEPWYCGTQAPIWMNGTHPTDMSEVTAQVCATSTSTNICGWKGTVHIRLCNESGSEYFVYLLAVPPGCPLAYCVDAASHKECIPPEVWLEDEFRCGVFQTTTEYSEVNPCVNYAFINMFDGRRSSEFYSWDSTISICDAGLDPVTWYRFEHDAGNRLIETPVEPWYCGTQAPIWMNGTHPTDMSEVTVKVCATYSTENICVWNGIAHIRLCNESGSEYFVYLLVVPPGCPMAYCVDAASHKECIPPEVWLDEEFRCGGADPKIQLTSDPLL